MSDAKSGALPWSAAIRTMLLGVLFVSLSSMVLMLRISPADEITQLRVGDVAPRDVLASKHVTYVSDVETTAARARAEAAVPEIYDLPDARIARRQVARAKLILDYFDSVRADSHASPEEKRDLIAAVNDLVLTDRNIVGLLTADVQTWTVVKAETLSVLDQAMRAEIRPAQLATARRRLPTLLGLDVSDQAVTIVVALAEDLIQPNTFVNEQRTAEERQLARDSVQPVTVTYEANESVLRAGDIVRPEHIEALRALGMQQPEATVWGNLGALGFMALVGALIGIYMASFRPRLLRQSRYVWLQFGLLLLFVTIIRLMVPGHTLLPYLVPTAALGMVVAALIDPYLAIMLTLSIGLVIGYVAEGSLELSVFSIVSGLVGIFTLGRFERVNRLLWASVYVALANALVILVFRIPSGEIDPIGLGQLMTTGLANGVLSASLTLLIFFVAGSTLHITTSLQLLDLARPTQPLLRQLLLRAPGTYHHSLMVSNLAEQAAERIGANALLSRVGAYYHDVGKTVRPYFFVENQMRGPNIQDRLDPYTSAQLIINHVKDGLEMARKYRLPQDVCAFIMEHQGTSVTKYFYHQAVDHAADPAQVNTQEFRYPGPKPQSRETAIVMLADSCEAAVRASDPNSVEEIDKIVHRIIMDKVTSGELDECELTMHDLNQIRSTFTQMLKGVYHPRLKYPEEVKDRLLAPAPAVEGGPAAAPGADAAGAAPAIAASQNETPC
jgi:hypothetical protein